MNSDKQNKMGYGLYFLEVLMVFGAYYIFGMIPGLIGILTGYFTKQSFEKTDIEPWKKWAAAIGIGLITAALLSMLAGQIMPSVSAE